MEKKNWRVIIYEYGRTEPFICTSIGTLSTREEVIQAYGLNDSIVRSYSILELTEDDPLFI